MNLSSLVRLMTQGAAILISVWAFLSCSQNTAGPVEVARSLRPAEGSWMPGLAEEELFGSVFSTAGQRLTNGSGYQIKLIVDGVVPTNGCIFRVANGVCIPRDSMPVMVSGWPPGFGTMWGWHDNIDGFINPCNPAGRRNPKSSSARAAHAANPRQQILDDEHCRLDSYRSWL